jgi:hypothetical protein
MIETEEEKTENYDRQEAVRRLNAALRGARAVGPRRPPKMTPKPAKAQRKRTPPSSATRADES